MKYALDRIKDGEDAMEYAQNAKRGISRSLNEVHELLLEAYERTEDNLVRQYLNKSLLIIEAQLDL